MNELDFIDIDLLRILVIDELSRIETKQKQVPKHTELDLMLLNRKLEIMKEKQK